MCNEATTGIMHHDDFWSQYQMGESLTCPSLAKISAHVIMRHPDVLMTSV